MAEPYEIRVVGAAPTPLRDAYHAFLRMSWWQSIGTIVLLYLLLNALFALAYLVTGGIANSPAGSFIDAYYFSVQTMGTIGYGAMYPISRAANTVVVAESVTGLLVTAVITGLVFAKVSRPTGRVQFARRAVITPMDGVPCLMVRLGNERGNRIVDSHMRVVMVRTDKTREGVVIYRTIDLALVREHMPALTRSWTVMHVIDERSPLFGRTPERLEAEETEITLTLIGLDDTSMSTVYAAHRYLASDVVWGARYADILSDLPDGDMLLDLRKFHDTTPTSPTADFPYPVVDSGPLR